MAKCKDCFEAMVAEENAIKEEENDQKKEPDNSIEKTGTCKINTITH